MINPTSPVPQRVSEHYAAVIIGSGFGGSVMACRLAEAGLKVCVLERGKSYPPGSFARSLDKMKRNFWDPSEGLYGLFDVWSFRGIGAVVSNGLGGRSLIYANVLLRKDEKWFVKEDIKQGGYEYWPVNRAELDPHYDRVEKMMNAQRYPFQHSPYKETPKTNAFKEAADKLNLDWYLPNLAVTFANKDRPPVPGECIQEDHRNLQETGPQNSDLSSEISKLFGKTDRSAGLLPLLGMGRDIPDGIMRLRKGDLDVDWSKKKSEPFFDHLRETMRNIAKALGADFMDNPTWYLGRTIAAHPLGGCPMGRNTEEGVVNAYGEVFNYPGFFIADGSVMPGPVGPNPSLTIGALADRFAEKVIENHHKKRS